MKTRKNIGPAKTANMQKITLIPNIMKKTILLGISCAALTFWAGTTSAATSLIDANFDDLPAGPVTFISPAPGVLPINRPTTGGSLDANTATVTANGGGNSLVVNKIANNTLDLRFWLNAADTVTAQQVEFSFDLTIDVAPSANFFINIRNSTGKVASALLLTTVGELRLYGYNTGIGDATVSDGTYLTVATLALSTSYNINMLLDFDTGKNSVSANGGTAAVRNFAASDTYGVRGLDFSTTYAATGEWTFDNVSMNIVPEPSVLSLLLGAFAFAAVLKRRRN